MRLNISRWTRSASSRWTSTPRPYINLSIPTTGEGPKRAASEAGSHIKLDFVLFLELVEGPLEQIDDAEVVFVDEGVRFSAVAGDDYS